MVLFEWPGQRVSVEMLVADSRVLCAAIKCLAPRFVGRKLSSLVSDFAATHRNFLGGQTRFMSPEVCQV